MKQPTKHLTNGADPADLLMTTGVVRACPDCRIPQIFVPADDVGACAYCCSTCGAAILIDLFLDFEPATVRGVA